MGEGRPKFIFISRSLRASLLWLAAALVVGGLPLGASFAMPRRRAGFLILSALLGGPLFALSVRALGKASALLVYPERKRVRHLRSLVRRHDAEEAGFAEVRGVEARLRSSVFEVGVRLKDGREFVLEKRRGREAYDDALWLAGVMEVPLSPESRSVFAPPSGCRPEARD